MSKLWPLQSSVVALGLVFVVPAAAAAQDSAERGRALVEVNCSACHAIGIEEG